MSNKSEEYQNLVKITENLYPCYLNDSQIWKDSPFKWIKGGITAREKGKIGETIVNKFLKGKGFVVDTPLNSDADLMVENRRVEVKFSTLWGNGTYKFQQIRKQEYDIIFCLGLSPKDAHAWVIRKSDIVWNDLKNQHGGKRGSDTWWISFSPPLSPHTWMRPQNGDLSKICQQLRVML